MSKHGRLSTSASSSPKPRTSQDAARRSVPIFDGKVHDGAKDFQRRQALVFRRQCSYPGSWPLPRTRLSLTLRVERPRPADSALLS
ncbi:hypothetical protein VDGL01_04911 [Verticillium dahliae]